MCTGLFMGNPSISCSNHHSFCKRVTKVKQLMDESVICQPSTAHDYL